MSCASYTAFSHTHTRCEYVCSFYGDSDVRLLVCVFKYSQKEDKYEEEIKVLTDKLKEVRWVLSVGLCLRGPFVSDVPTCVTGRDSC